MLVQALQALRPPLLAQPLAWQQAQLLPLLQALLLPLPLQQVQVPQVLLLALLVQPVL